MDLHQDCRGQNPICSSYTTRQTLVEPEGVAPSPCRIKSPVPVCCGFDSVTLVGERGLAPPRLTDSRSVGSALPAEPLAQETGVPGRNFACALDLRMVALWYTELRERWCSWPGSHRQPQPSESCTLVIELQEQNRMEPPAGAAPARHPYNGSRQAAARRRNGRRETTCTSKAA